MNYLIDGLIDRNHTITLYATGDSVKRSGMNLVSVFPTELENSNYSVSDKEKLNHKLTQKLGRQLIADQEKYDVIVNFCLGAGLSIMPHVEVPLVNRISEELTFEAIDRLSPYRNFNYISLSYAQRKPLPELNYVANIYNGIDMKSVLPPSNPGDYLVFVGRISRQKNPHKAILAAKRLNIKLLIVGRYKDEGSERNYYEHIFLPLLQENSRLVEWIGEVEEKGVYKYFNKAIASLHPVSFREPFGTAVIESMANGCPPITFNRGSYPEIIEHGVSGYVVEDVEEMVSKIKTIQRINRNYCQEYVKQNFTVERMVNSYELLLQTLVHRKTSLFTPLSNVQYG